MGLWLVICKVDKLSIKKKWKMGKGKRVILDRKENEEKLNE